MRTTNKRGGFPKNATADSNTPGTSADNWASGDESQNKVKRPSLLHIDREFRFRRHMIPRRHPMFAIDGPPRLMAPHARFFHRIHSPHFMLRDRRPSMMSARNMFPDAVAPMGMGPPPPRGPMVPMHGRPKEPEQMQKDSMKPPTDKEKKTPVSSQKQDDMPKQIDGPDRLQDFQRKRAEPFRSGPYPMPILSKQERFARYPNRSLGMPAFGMNKPYSPQGKPFPRAPSRYMMTLPPSQRRMIRFPERYMDLSDYTMDFQGRLMNQQGKYINPLNLGRISQGVMPVPPPIRQRFMQRPEQYMDMSRYTMDFDGRYRDNYGRQMNPMEHYNANVGRYLRNLPPQHRRLARFPEHFVDFSRYTMDFEGRFMDNYGRHVDPLRHFHGSYGKVPMNPPLNQRRFIQHPEKYMDMSPYTMDFQGRFIDRHGRPINLLGRHFSHPGRFMQPSPCMHRNVPMIPRRFATPPLKHMDMSRYSMDFQGRLMDNQGRYVKPMRRLSNPFMPYPQYNERNLMNFPRRTMDFQDRFLDKYNVPVDAAGRIPDFDPKPNVFFERRRSAEHRPISVLEKSMMMGPDLIISGKDYPEFKAGPEFRRPSSTKEHRVEFQEHAGPEIEPPAPADDEALMIMSMGDEITKVPFMKQPMFKSLHTGIRPPFFIYPGGKPYIPEEYLWMATPMMNSNYETFMPTEKFSDNMMMAEMMNTRYPLYESVMTSFVTPESDFMMNDRRWFLSDWFEGMDDKMPHSHGRMTPMMGPRMYKRSSFRIANEPRQQDHLPPVMENDVDESFNKERRSSRFDDRHSHSMEEKEFDPHRASFDQHEDIDCPELIPEMRERQVNGFFSHGDYEDYMFDGSNYPDYYVDDFYSKDIMHRPPMGFMNDEQPSFGFNPECMGMVPGFGEERGSYPYPFMSDNFAFGFYNDDEDEEHEQEEREEDEEEEEGEVEEEEEHEEGHHRMRTDSEKQQSGPTHRTLAHHNAQFQQDEEDMPTGPQRRRIPQHIFLSEEGHFFDEKHALYLERTAEYLRERGRFLREQHEHFLQELQNASPLSHPRVQAEAQAHASVVEEEVNATEAEADAVERIVRTARRVSGGDHQRLFAGNRHHPIDNQSGYPHKYMNEN